MKIQISRRGFGPTAALLGAASTLPFPSEHSLPQLSMIGPLPADAVKIAAREYPMGPCAEAVEGIKSVVRGSGRYLYEETFNLSRVLAEQEGVKPGLRAALSLQRTIASVRTCSYLTLASIGDRRSGLRSRSARRFGLRRQSHQDPADEGLRP